MKKLTFNKDKKFKIMQIADVQDTHHTSPDTLNFMRACLEKEKPDLVIFTGDQLKGYGVSFRGGDQKAKVKKAITNIVSVVDDMGIPFTFTFGNHDHQSGGDKAYQRSIYESFDNFVCENEYDGIEGNATFALEIKSSSSDKTALNVFVFDSLSNDKVNGGYEAVTKEQNEWLLNCSKQIAEKNGGEKIPAIVFQHIPVCEMYNLLEKSSKDDKEAILGNISHREYYKLPSELKKDGAFMLENIACPTVNNGQFDAFLEEGNIFAAYFGHDHNNSFIGNYKGIDLGYTQGAGFNVYGPGLDRAVRVFEFDEDDVKNYKTRTVTYRSVLGKRLKRPLKNFIYTNAPSSIDAAKPMIIKGVIAAAVIVAVGVGIYLLKK